VYRVLVWSNPLVVDKIAHTFQFYMDSGFIFSKQLISDLPHDWRFTWVIPDKIKPDDYGWFLDANEIVDVIPYPYPTNIHQARYEFYGKILRDRFEYGHDVDVILNNQPEVSANLRTWASNQRREYPVILSFYHWLDVPESAQFGRELSGYFWRQWDGFLSSDSVFFHNKYSYDLFSSEVDRKVKDTSEIFATKVGLFHPAPTQFGLEYVEMPEEKVILFNHRLNNTTNWKFVVEKLNLLWEKRKDFRLWITDEGGYSLHKRYLDTFPFVYIKRIPENNYGYVISNSHFSICAHKGYSTWNMAILDSISNGLFTVVPADGVYIDMLSPFYHGMMIDNMWHRYEDLQEKVDALLDTDRLILAKKNEQVRDYVLGAYSSSATLTKLHIIEHLSRIRGKKPPAKYDQVYDFIKSANGDSVEKREWVNKFWSFHVNSNFQRIRHWLLSDGGIVDDTTKEYTTYHAII